MESDRQDKYLVVGISPEHLHGSEETIHSPVFFLEIENRHYFTMDSPWVEESLREVKDSDKKYIQWLSEDKQFYIEEGDKVYLAGSRLLHDLRKLDQSEDLIFNFSEWDKLIDGYSKCVMTDRFFEFFIEDLIRDLWIIVEDGLWNLSGSEKPSKRIHKVFTMYSILGTHSKNKKILHTNRGLYYSLAGDSKSLELEKYFSTRINSSFDSEQEYLDAVEKRKKSIGDTKLTIDS